MPEFDPALLGILHLLLEPKERGSIRTYNLCRPLDSISYVLIEEDEMRIGGWIFFIISWGLILGLTTLCFIKVFSRKELR